MAQFLAQAAWVGGTRREEMTLLVQLQRTPEAGMQHPDWGSHGLLHAWTDLCSSHVISQQRCQELHICPNMPQTLALGGLALEPVTQTPTGYLYPPNLACSQGLHSSHHLTQPGNQVKVEKLNGPSSNSLAYLRHIKHLLDELMDLQLCASMPSSCCGCSLIGLQTGMRQTTKKGGLL